MIVCTVLTNSGSVPEFPELSELTGVAELAELAGGFGVSGSFGVGSGVGLVCAGRDQDGVETFGTSGLGARI
jgi:hypothetical protein